MNNPFIVGAGITGVVAADFLSDYSPTICDKARFVGGCLKDICVDQNSYYSGCQYLDPNQKYAIDFMAGHSITLFSHEYASYTDIFDEITISSQFAGPCVRNCKAVVNSSIKPIVNLRDRLDLYPSQIRIGLSSWFDKLNINLDAIHHRSAVPWQAQRVYCIGNEDNIVELKRSPLGDELYGLPRPYRGKTSTLSAVPCGGFDQIFNSKMLQMHSCEWQLSRSIKPFLTEKSRFGIVSADLKLSPDLLVWTADPKPLIRAALEEEIYSKPIKTEIIVGNLEWKVLKPFYIQVFSLKSSVTRIYVYNTLNQGAYAVEKIFDRVTTSEVLEFAQNVLDSCFPAAKIQCAVARSRRLRYDTISVKDFDLITKFLGRHYSNLVCPDFLAYDRTSRIASMKARLDNALVTL